MTYFTFAYQLSEKTTIPNHVLFIDIQECSLTVSGLNLWNSLPRNILSSYKSALSKCFGAKPQF